MSALRFYFGQGAKTCSVSCQSKHLGQQRSQEVSMRSEYNMLKQTGVARVSDMCVCVTMQDGEAAVSNPGPAYGASALGPSAGGASTAAPAQPDIESGLQSSQPLWNGGLDAQNGDDNREHETLRNGQDESEHLEDGEEEGEVKKEQSGASKRALAGLGLPFDPVALTFKDIHYFVKNPNQRSQELELLKVCSSKQSVPCVAEALF